MWKWPSFDTFQFLNASFSSWEEFEFFISRPLKIFTQTKEIQWSNWKQSSEEQEWALKKQSSVIRTFRNVWIPLHGLSTGPDMYNKEHDPAQPALYNVTIKMIKWELCKAADNIKLVWIDQEKLKEEGMERMACSCFCFDF